MAFRLILPEQGSESTKLVIPEKGNEPIVKESLSGSALRNIAGVGASALGGITGLAKLPESIYQHAEKTRNAAVRHDLNTDNIYGSDPVITEWALQDQEENTYKPKVAPVLNKAASGIQSSLGITPEYLQPKNETESIVQDVASNIGQNIALAAITGGLGSAKNIGSFIYNAGKRAVQGKVGKYATKALGGGELAQLVAEIGTPAVLQSLNVGNVVKGLTPVRNDLYEKAEKAAGVSRVDAGQTKKIVEKLKDSKFLTVPEHKDINNNFNKIYKSIDEGNKISVQDAFKIKTNLNELKYESKLPDAAKKMYNRLLPEFNSVLKNASKEFPEFGKSYNAANDISINLAKAQNTQKFIQDSIKGSSFIKKPVAELFKPLSQGKNALSTAFSLGHDVPEQAIEYYTQALASASKEQLPSFLRYVNKLDKVLEKSKSDVEKKGNFRLISE